MDSLFLLLALLSLVALVVGLINPGLIKMKTRKRALLTTFAAFILFFILFGVTAEPSEVTDRDDKETTAEEKQEKSKEDEEKQEAEKKEKEETDKVKKEKAEKKKQEEQEAEGKENEKKEKEKKQKEAVDGWQDFRGDLLEHYKDAQILDIKTDEHFMVFYAYVPNEFKLSSEEEKTYYVEEVGPILEEDLNSHFGESAHLYFKYEDNNDMATRKMFGGWKIK